MNNVGISYNYPEYFLEVQDRDRIFSQIIKCNITSVVEMTKLVLPQMKADQKGIILNISSIAGTIPQPLLAVYSASKVFNSLYFKASLILTEIFIISLFIPGIRW